RRGIGEARKIGIPLDMEDVVQEELGVLNGRLIGRHGSSPAQKSVPPWHMAIETALRPSLSRNAVRNIRKYCVIYQENGPPNRPVNRLFTLINKSLCRVSRTAPVAAFRWFSVPVSRD